MRRDWDAVSLTQALVRLESASGAEGAVADCVEASMRAVGLRDVHRDEVGNVVGFAGPPEPTTALLFDAHMDVVPVMGDWSFPPFGGDIVQGRLLGRGSTDMKGALGAAICGVGEAARSGLLTRQVAVSASVLEETIEGLALSAVLERIRPEMVVICEPSSLAIKHGQRGRIEVLIKVVGRPAHAAHPEHGKNPLLLAAAALLAIETMELPTNSALGAAIMVPTDIITSPYPSISSIPPSLTIRYDRRTVSGETTDSVLAALREMLAKIDADAFEVSISSAPVRSYTGHVLEGDRSLASWLGDRDAPLAAAAAESLQDVGREVRYGVYAFCTNGSELAGRRKIPTIGLGPGAEADAHTVDESISVEELSQAAAIYRSLCMRIAGKRHDHQEHVRTPDDVSSDGPDTARGGEAPAAVRGG